MKLKNRSLATAAAIAAGRVVLAEPAPAANVPLGDLAIEELLSLQVSSVSRKEESLFQTAAAIGVLTSDDIRRTGAVSLPELLRYGTGVQVAKHSARSHAIGIRGFNLDASNKIEVQLDGRSLYTPFFSGVLWEMQDYILEDLDRVEIIRGPGAAMWGANAVNGVISIYSKGAEATQGTMVSAAVAAPQAVAHSARVGFQISENTFARVYTKYLGGDDAWQANGEKLEAGPWEMLRVGFRSDFLPQDGARLMVQGEYFSDGLGIRDTPYPMFEGGSFLARWEQTLNSDWSYEAQAYYDAYERLYIGAFHEDRQTVSANGKLRYQGLEGHDMVAGAGYRYSWDQTQQLGIPAMEPPNEGFGVLNLFAQDEIALGSDASVVVGATVGYNSLIGRWDLQPNLRWKRALSDNALIWGAASRAVRTPSRADTDLRWVLPGFEFRGSRDYRSEEALSYEIGHRYRMGEAFSVETALYYTEYDDLPSVEPQGGGLYLYQNMLEGETWGGEIEFDYRPTYWSSFKLSYTRLNQSFQLKEGSAANPVAAPAAVGNDPESMALLSATFELPRAVELSGYLRHMGELSAPHVPSYLLMDLRLAWAPGPGMEFSLVGRNLLDHRHPEFGADVSTRTEYARGLQARATFRF